MTLDLPTVGEFDDAGVVVAFEKLDALTGYPARTVPLISWFNALETLPVGWMAVEAEFAVAFCCTEW